MGRAPCCDKNKVKKGAWTPEEDHILVQYIMKYGHGTWRALPRHAGLQRCGKSCRLRWINYLRPDIKRGPFTPEEEATIIRFHQMLGNRWSTIASQLPGRTDNEIKNFWNTHLKKRVSHVSNDKQHQKDPKSPKDAVQSDTSSTSHPEINNEDNNGVEADGFIKSSSPSPSNLCLVDDNNDFQSPSNLCLVDDNNDFQSPSNSCFMEDNNDFLKWLFDIEEDSSIGNLSGRDMEQLDLVLQDMDMIDGSIASQNGSQDNKKDVEETLTEPTAPSSSSNINEDSSGSQSGAISQTQTTTYVEENHDSNSKSDSLVHQANDNQPIEKEDSKEVVENMFPESTLSFPYDAEDYLGSDLGFLLDFPLEDIDI